MTADGMVMEWNGDGDGNGDWGKKGWGAECTVQLKLTES